MIVKCEVEYGATVNDTNSRWKIHFMNERLDEVEGTLVFPFSRSLVFFFSDLNLDMILRDGIVYYFRGGEVVLLRLDQLQRERVGGKDVKQLTDPSILNDIFKIIDGDGESFSPVQAIDVSKNNFIIGSQYQRFLKKPIVHVFDRKSINYYETAGPGYGILDNGKAVSHVNLCEEADQFLVATYQGIHIYQLSNGEKLRSLKFDNQSGSSYENMFLRPSLLSYVKIDPHSDRSTNPQALVSTFTNLSTPFEHWTCPRYSIYQELNNGWRLHTIQDLMEIDVGGEEEEKKER